MKSVKNTLKSKWMITLQFRRREEEKHIQLHTHKLLKLMKMTKSTHAVIIMMVLKTTRKRHGGKKSFSISEILWLS